VVLVSGASTVSGATHQHARLARGALYLTTQNLGLSLLSAIGFSILARIISTKEMGMLAILLLINATCVAFFTWFAPAVTKFIGENLSKGSKSAAAAAFYQALRADLLIYIPVSGAIYFGAPFLASHVLGDSSYALLFRVVAFDTIVYGAMLQVLVAAMLGLQKFREIAIVSLVTGGILKQVLVIVLLILMRNFVGLAIGWLVSDAMTVAAYFPFVVRALGPPRFDFPFARLFHFYLPLEFSSILIYAQTWFDRAMLILFVPLATLGIYNAAVTVFGVLVSVSAGVTSMLISAYSSLAGKTSNRDSFREAIYSATRYASIAITPLAFGLLSIARPVLTIILGKSYAPGYVPLMILSGALGITAFSTGYTGIFVALEKTRVAALINAVAVAVALVVMYELDPIWGMLGASTGSASVMVVTAFLEVLILKRWKVLKLDLVTIAKTLAAGTVMVATVVAVQVVEYGKFMLPLYVVIGASVYLIMLRLLRVVNVGDLSLLRLLLGNRLSRVSSILDRLFGVAH